MAYTPPLYNLNADVWLIDGTIKPSAGPADITGLVCQKYLPSRGMWDLTPPWSAGFYLAWHPPVHLRFPRSSPFAGAWPTWKVVCVEVPSGSGQYYRAYWADIQHEGFTNEYVEWIGVQCDADLKAIPPAGGSQPTGVGADAGGFTPAADPPVTTLPPGPFPPTPYPAAAFMDGFVDTPNTDLALHTANSGESWTSGIGTAEITSGGIGAEATLTAPGQSWWTANYVGPVSGPIQLNFTSPSAFASGFYMGLLFRASTPNDWFGALVEWDGVSQFLLSIYRCVGGSATRVHQGTALFSLSTSTPYNLIVECNTTTIKATLYGGGTVIDTQTYVDGTDITKPGLGVWWFVDATRPAALVQQLNT